MMQAAILFRQHGNRRVVAHAADRFLGVLRHRMQDQLHVLERQAESKLALAQLIAAEIAGDRRGVPDLVDGDDVLDPLAVGMLGRSEEHTSELQSLMRISYAVFCLKKKKTN